MKLLDIIHNITEQVHCYQKKNPKLKGFINLHFYCNLFPQLDFAFFVEWRDFAYILDLSAYYKYKEQYVLCDTILVATCHHVLCSVAQLCPTLCDPWTVVLPGPSVCGISKARILEWVAMSYARGSSWARDWTYISCITCIGRWILYHCTAWESQCMSSQINV